MRALSSPFSGLELQRAASIPGPGILAALGWAEGPHCVLHAVHGAPATGVIPDGWGEMGSAPLGRRAFWRL